jgi:hypothetical protein
MAGLFADYEASQKGLNEQEQPDLRKTYAKAAEDLEIKHASTLKLMQEALEQKAKSAFGPFFDSSDVSG